MEFIGTLKNGVSKETGREYSYIEIEITPNFKKRVFLTAMEIDLINQCKEIEELKKQLQDNSKKN